MRCGPSAPPRRSARSPFTARNFRARWKPKNSGGFTRRSPNWASMRWCCRIRTRWHGPSTSAAPMSRIRRYPCPMRWCRKMAVPSSSSTTANSPIAPATTSNRPPTSRNRTRWRQNSANWRTAAPRSRSTAPQPPTRAQKPVCPAPGPPPPAPHAPPPADALSRLISAAGGKPVRGNDPVSLLKAVKNATEIEGTKTAHQRDAVALARFLAWIDREAPSGALTEIDTVEALETFRRDTGALRDVSFPTIAGTGPNGAIVHYRVTRKTNRRIAPGDLLLIDSGAQYEDGTTDVTRTIAIGVPTLEMQDRFTRVLRGHIAISRALFPDGTTGAQLDTLARQYLWQAGIDFEHGTGHGVGSYLSVHEGPARISKLGTTPLKRGMILSNEPGYYKTDSYGIRIENLELVIGTDIAGAEKPVNAFETLTLAPIDRRLVDLNMLSGDELNWLNEYHARVRHEVRPHVDEATKAWLDAATATLSL